MPYLFARNGVKYPDEASGFLTTLSKVGQKADRWGGKYRVKPSKVEPWGEPTGRVLMRLAVARAMRKAAWGGLIKVEMGIGKPTSAVFLIKKKPPAISEPEPLRMYTGAVVDLARGNGRIASAATYIKGKCPRVQCSGWVYTRPVAGTSVWSQHSRWATGGNAIDLTVYNDDDSGKGTDMAGTQDVCDVLVAAARAGALELERVIFKDKQYRYPSFEPVPYTGKYHYHVHAEGRPIQTGRPVDAP